MKISIFGTGYVGLVVGVCYAEMGHEVLCCDTDIEKINKLNSGDCVIYEPGLDNLFNKNFKNKKICFVTDVKEAIIFGDIIISAVGTPTDINGKTDLQFINQVALNFGKYIDRYKSFVNKSTAPVGTCDICNEIIINELNNRRKKIDFEVISNPEFLREGSAIEDFLNPDRIIIGISNHNALDNIRKVYEPLSKKGIRVLETDIKTSELIKYASNSYLAMKLSFINEISNLSEILGANIDDISKGIGLDYRIGEGYLQAGIGYGGSCFSKDIKSFINFGKANGCNLKLLENVEKINEKQKFILIKKLIKYLSDLDGKIISIWGLSYKENTDDLRDAPCLEIIKKLLSLGVKEIRVFDPVSNNKLSKHFVGENSIHLGKDKYSVLEKSDGLIVLTGWDEFNNTDFDIMKNKMANKLVLDGRNFLSKKDFIENGFIYEGIGK